MNWMFFNCKISGITQISFDANTFWVYGSPLQPKAGEMDDLSD